MEFLITPCQYIDTRENDNRMKDWLCRARNKPVYYEWFILE